MASGTGSQHAPGPAGHLSTDTIDPITKFKFLVPHLKESLQVVNPATGRQFRAKSS